MEENMVSIPVSMFEKLIRADERLIMMQEALRDAELEAFSAKEECKKYRELYEMRLQYDADYRVEKEGTE